MIKNFCSLIALDIDGTLAVKMQNIPPTVIHYLTTLHQQGAMFVFVTGRTFEFGHQVLKELPFSYYYAAHNGAILLSMPDRRVIIKNYLDGSVLLSMEKICESTSTDFVIYTGLEGNNLCYYRPSHFSPNLRYYLEKRRQSFNEEWIAVKNFKEIPFKEFPSIKCFGEEETAQYVAERMEKNLELHAPVIKDPFGEGNYVVQATHSQANKGYALRQLIDQLGYEGVVIAAGDDLNDLSMFEQAHIKVAMADAPLQLKAKADIIAPPASSLGIIKGLEEALAQ
ncbi:hypothetical protein DB41_GK00130 [Neochlamydia sp. TUME1]|uniref:HAD-IIB family hydrolase n=1 Tax=Neochlamydia sp. TUME1 TaxID=1478174 RepID=UPI00057E1319|nr:HAD family hydrolase [Neochlamydia sp. TUME1]KIC76299.1 hypothetical protein DB41_GK00130 [Neochlamydia sp. TUME1]